MDMDMDLDYRKVNRIKELRLSQRKTLKQVAYSIGITDGQLSSYENGKRAPRNKQTWQVLADYFDVDVAYLMGVSDIPHKRMINPNSQKEAIINLIDTLNEDGLNAAVQQLTLLTKITEFRRK